MNNNIVTQVIASAALNATGYGAALTSTGASYVLISTGPGDSCAHPVTVKNNSVTDFSALTITITGTDENDAPLTETRAHCGGSATITSTAYFKSVTSIVPSATTGVATFDIGWTASSKCAWIYPILGVGTAPFNVGIGCTAVTGSPTYSVKYTFDGSAWFAVTNVSAVTASATGSITSPIAAFRMEFTAAGSVTLTSIQSPKC